MPPSAAPIIVTTPEQLTELVDRAVDRALARREEEWILPSDAAKVLGVQPKTLPSMVRRDGLPAHRVGRSFRYRRSELDRWLEERRVRPGSHTSKHVGRIKRLKEAT